MLKEEMTTVGAKPHGAHAVKPLLGLRRQPGRPALTVFRLPLPLQAGNLRPLLGRRLCKRRSLGRELIGSMLRRTRSSLAASGFRLSGP